MTFNKYLTAVMLAAVSSVPVFAESNTQVTGRVQYNVSDIQLRSGGLPGDTFGWLDARIGVQTYQPMENGFSVFGIAEYDITSDDGLPGLDSKSNELGPRYVFGGIDFNEYGKVSIGRVGSGLLALYNLTDFFAINGGGEVMASRASVLDKSAAAISRQDNTIEYANTLQGIDFTFAYIMNSGVFSQTGVDKGFNFSVSKSFGSEETGRFKPVFAYQKTEAIEAHPTGQGIQHFHSTGRVEDYTFWGIGAEYYLGDYGASLVYSEDTLSKTGNVDSGKNRGIESMVRYSGFENLDLRLGYFWMENSAYGQDLINDIVFDAHYFFTPKARLIASYSIRNANEFIAKEGAYSQASNNKQDDFFYLAFRLNF
ncbi:porin [Thaumasiovibrio subtropicus]|uniref:porin n=1 Tax=Thaumasiovibrio subtropicus TaxID=1891207 RepID=UPI000B350315|nr:porin [Thaumasiovibrio subtropicus]